MVWDVGIWLNGGLRSLVDSGFYPTDAARAVQMGEQVSFMLGLAEPIRVCGSVEDARAYLSGAGGDAIAVWPFDWDAVSW